MGSGGSTRGRESVNTAADHGLGAPVPMGPLEVGEPSERELTRAVATVVGVDASLVRVESTHASRVFIAGGLAFKLKRRVDLGFLDFRSLESRRRACHEEVMLNRRLAPEVYLGVATVHRDAASPQLVIEWPRADEVAAATAPAAPAAPAALAALAAPLQDRDLTQRIDAAAPTDAIKPIDTTGGAIDDACVVMRELPMERMLDRLLERGEVGEADARDLEDLARRLARFHRVADRGPVIAALRTPDRVRARLEATLAGLESAAASTAAMPAAAPAADPAAVLSVLRTRACAMLEHAMPLLERRRESGCVVDGHGDLHAGNICMVPGGAVAYDCLEFSQALRVRDTSGDLAFLAMDLEAHGRCDLAERVMRAYLDEARLDSVVAAREVDFETPQRWFRLSDALVRSLVESLRVEVKHAPHARAAARRYLDLACGYALEPSLIIMCGLPGSGKSTVARALARPLRARIIRSDAVRKSLAGIAPTERAPEALYAESITKRVYNELMCQAAGALADGHHVILDAAFPTQALRRLAIHHATRLRPLGEHASSDGSRRCAWLLVECIASRDELTTRLRARAKDPRELSDADERVMHVMETIFEPPVEVDATHRMQVASGDDAAVHSIIERLVRLGRPSHD